MREERIFEISSVTDENLSYLSCRQGENLEMRICEMSFAAEKIAASAVSLVEDGMSVSEIAALLSDELGAENSLTEDSSPNESGEAVARFLSFLKGVDKANFSTLLLEKLRDNGINASEKDFLEESGAKESFIYVRNSLSDEAYDVFSQEFDSPRVLYSDSFKEACFAVADGKAGYCILPFEERAGMRIPGIYNLISRLDLKIVAVTPVFGFEGTADMKYALVSRGFKIPEISENTDRYLEINVSCDSSVSLGELLTVSEYFGLSVFRINTFEDERENENSYFSVILKDGGSSFTELLTYLSIFADTYSAMGIYKNIE